MRIDSAVWFKVCDSFADHDKTADLVAECPPAVGLWTITASRCGKALTDGVISESLLSRCGRLAGLSPAVTRKAAAALVKVGMWHDAKTVRRCDHCSSVKLKPGELFFHDWWEYNPTEDETLIPTERMRWRRKQELKRNRSLCERIVERDRNLCRYCGVRVNWKDRRGAAGGTYDHVDPDGPNSLANVVVACRRCNGIKRDRTPEEAGMPLRPEPEPYQSGSGSRPDPTQVEPGSDLAPRARHARDGAGQDGTGSDLDRDQIGPGPREADSHRDATDSDD